MKKEQIEALRREFPGKNVVLIPEDDPKEVVVELGGDENESMAVALIDKSVIHRHARTTETYLVESGTLILYVGGMRKKLGPGESFTIPPGILHWAKGDAVRVLITASPPWCPEDHLFMPNDEKIRVVNRYQDAGFVHELTCGVNSGHEVLRPKEADGRVVLCCPTCEYVQEYIPESVLMSEYYIDSHPLAKKSK